MKRLSIELVPRSEEGLRDDLSILKKVGIHIDVINIPDLLRFDLRSWEGAAISATFYPASIPHVRAMDIDLTKPLPMAGYMKENGIHEVLVIEGDPPQDMKHTVYPTVTTDVIRKFREELPGIRVYAGIDQYRGSMRQEEYRIRRKLQAGAEGFFTQPFYDMRFLEMYQDMLDGIDVYWGISPIESTRSQSYWELKNHVVFPKSFEPTRAWSIDFAKRVVEYADKTNGSVYIMPIKGNLEEYLSGIFF